MGALTIIRQDTGHEALRAKLLSVLEKQGFGAPQTLSVCGHTVLVSPKRVAPVDNLVQDADGSFAAAAGTLFYRGAYGGTALRRILADALQGGIDDVKLQGCFALAIYARNRLLLFTDRLGQYKLYRSPDGAVHSSSFLACLGAVPSPRLNRQGVYEYVFQGACYGGDTVIRGITLLSPEQRHILGPETATETRANPFVLKEGIADFESHVARVAGTLRQVYDPIVAAFGDNIDTALSGGYDSRLTLALLRDRGVTPAVHVYGRDSDPDVRIAKRIAEGEGFPLVHEDKSQRAPGRPEHVAEAVGRQFWAFDGWPTDGIVGSGSDLATRDARVRDGRLALNGGGGEVFRNFFYLSNRRFTARQLLWTFYSQFDPRVARPPFRETDYLDRLAEKLLSLFPDAEERLTRSEVEFVYPGFRGRFWTGRNTSLNNQIGPALTPFFEVAVVRDALTVPLAFKNHGRFEAAVITAIDSRLAAYPSAYGRDFAQPPGLRHRLKDWTTYLRPPRLRRYSYRWKNRMRHPALPEMLKPDYRRHYLPEGLPVMESFFHLGEIRDAERLNRIFTLEYLCRMMEVAA